MRFDVPLPAVGFAAVTVKCIIIIKLIIIIYVTYFYFKETRNRETNNKIKPTRILDHTLGRHGCVWCIFIFTDKTNRFVHVFREAAYRLNLCLKYVSFIAWNSFVGIRINGETYNVTFCEKCILVGLIIFLPLNGWKSITYTQVLQDGALHVTYSQRWRTQNTRFRTILFHRHRSILRRLFFGITAVSGRRAVHKIFVLIFITARETWPKRFSL